MVDCGRWSEEGHGNAEQVGFRYRAVSQLLPARSGSMRLSAPHRAAFLSITHKHLNNVRHTDEKTEVC